MDIEVGDYVTIGKSSLTWLVFKIYTTGRARLISGQSGVHRVEELTNLKLHTKGTGNGN